MRVDAASQVGAQLAFNVARYPAFMSGASLREKGLEVTRDQAVERCRLRSVLFVVSAVACAAVSTRAHLRRAYQC